MLLSYISNSFSHSLYRERKELISKYNLRTEGQHDANHAQCYLELYLSNHLIVCFPIILHPQFVSMFLHNLNTMPAVQKWWWWGTLHFHSNNYKCLLWRKAMCFNNPLWKMILVAIWNENKTKMTFLNEDCINNLFISSYLLC